MTKHILLIGGTKGIGSSLTSQLLQDGVQVTQISRSKPDSELAQVNHHVCDVVQSPENLPDLSGPIDGMVYLPGTINLKPFESLTEDEIFEDWKVNFLGAFRCIKKYMPKLRESGNASIVLMSTVAVARGMPMHSSIASAKAAVEGLAKSLAAELAPSIRVNLVAPSITKTSLSLTA